MKRKMILCSLSSLITSFSLAGPAWLGTVTASGEVDILGRDDLQTAGDCHFALVLKTGWNLIGSVFESVGFSAPDTKPAGTVEPFCYRWVPGTGYVLTTTIEPRMGHWVAATENCALKHLTACED